MYMGTCELYDANNPGADGNLGWSCYNRDTQVTDALAGTFEDFEFKVEEDDLEEDEEDFYLF